MGDTGKGLRDSTVYLLQVLKEDFPQPAKAIKLLGGLPLFDSKDDYTYSNLIRKKGEEGNMKNAEPTVFLFFLSFCD